MAVTRVNMWILFFLALVSWLIALAGLSAVQEGCGSNSLPGPGANRCPTTNYLTCNPQCASYPDGQLLCTFYSGAVSCSRFFNYQWWQLFVVIWLMVTLLFAKGTFSRASMLSLLTITTLQMVDFTGTFGALVNTAGINNATGSGDTRINAAFAGGLLVSLFNFLLILAVGYIDREDDPGQNWAITKQPANNGQFATTATAAGSNGTDEKQSTEMTPVKEKGSDEDEADVAPTTPGL